MTIFVEFIQKQPAYIDGGDKWLRAECGDMHQAEVAEKRFHEAGWAARVVIVESVTHYPAPRPKKHP